jgi:hypothetical protein
MKHVGSKPYEKERDEYIELYRCGACEQIWKLKEPNVNFGGGWFIYESTKQPKSQKGCAVFLSLISSLLITWITIA